MKLRLSVAAAAILALLLGQSGFSGAVAQERPAPPPPPPVQMIPLPERATIAPAISCADLAKRSFARVKDGPAKIMSATLQPAAQGRPEFCFVKGYVAPTIQFEMKLPTTGYTGRYLQGGCGGNCGRVPGAFTPRCDNAPAFSGAFALGFEDSGHQGGDGVWALGGEQVRIDFAYRAVHAFAQAAKAIVTAYYGQAPAYSYFSGCSDGGREAMSVSQRYPTDFNGIIAGSPAFIITEAMERFIWESKWGHDAQGKAVFDTASAQLIHDAVIAACDPLDGLKDGQIDDPRACHYDPKPLVCKKPGQTACLTTEQADVARKFWDGPRDANGVHLYPGGEPYGAELQWGGFGGLSQAGYSMIEDDVRNMSWLGTLPEDVTVNTWKFDVETFRELSRRGAIYDANDADLNPLRAAGGKLLLWHGAADPASGVYAVADYYQRMAAKVGGMDAARGFVRYFMAPGVYHCGGGYVAYEEDFLGAMVNWVEKGVAPDKVTATARLDDGTIRNRPVYAYPVQAAYLGKGDINDAANFGPRMPKGPINDLYDWAGSPAAR